MTLEQMQREERERLDEMHRSRTVPVSRSEQHKLSDQHTSATWKAALNSIIESGLLEEKKKDCDNCNDCESNLRYALLAHIYHINKITK